MLIKQLTFHGLDAPPFIPGVNAGAAPPPPSPPARDEALVEAPPQAAVDATCSVAADTTPRAALPAAASPSGAETGAVSAAPYAPPRATAQSGRAAWTLPKPLTQRAVTPAATAAAPVPPPAPVTAIPSDGDVAPPAALAHDPASARSNDVSHADAAMAVQHAETVAAATPEEQPAPALAPAHCAEDTDGARAAKQASEGADALTGAADSSPMRGAGSGINADANAAEDGPDTPPQAETAACAANGASQLQSDADDEVVDEPSIAARPAVHDPVARELHPSTEADAPFTADTARAAQHSAGAAGDAIRCSSSFSDADDAADVGTLSAAALALLTEDGASDTVHYVWPLLSQVAQTQEEAEAASAWLSPDAALGSGADGNSNGDSSGKNVDAARPQLVSPSAPPLALPALPALQLQPPSPPIVAPLVPPPTSPPPSPPVPTPLPAREPGTAEGDSRSQAAAALDVPLPVSASEPAHAPAAHPSDASDAAAVDEAAPPTAPESVLPPSRARGFLSGAVSSMASVVGAVARLVGAEGDIVSEDAAAAAADDASAGTTGAVPAAKNAALSTSAEGAGAGAGADAGADAPEAASAADAAAEAQAAEETAQAKADAAEAKKRKKAEAAEAHKRKAKERAAAAQTPEAKAKTKAEGEARQQAKAGAKQAKAEQKQKEAEAAAETEEAKAKAAAEAEKERQREAARAPLIEKKLARLAEEKAQTEARDEEKAKRAAALKEKADEARAATLERRLRARAERAQREAEEARKAAAEEAVAAAAREAERIEQRAKLRTDGHDAAEAVEALVRCAAAAQAAEKEKDAAAAHRAASAAAEKSYDDAAKALTKMASAAAGWEREQAGLAAAAAADKDASQALAALQQRHETAAAVDLHRAQFAGAYVAAAEAAHAARTLRAACKAAVATESATALRVLRGDAADLRATLRGAHSASLTATETAQLEMRIATAEAAAAGHTAALETAAAELGLPASAAPRSFAKHAARLREAAAALHLNINADDGCRTADAALVAKRVAAQLCGGGAARAALGFANGTWAIVSRALDSSLKRDVDAMSAPDAAWLCGTYAWTLGRACTLRDDFSAAADAAQHARRSEVAAAQRAAADADARLRELRVRAERTGLHLRLDEVRAARARRAHARAALLALHGRPSDDGGINDDLDVQLVLMDRHSAPISAKQQLRAAAAARDAAAARSLDAKVAEARAARSAFDRIFTGAVLSPAGALALARWAGLEGGHSSLLLPYSRPASMARIAAPYDKAPLALLASDLAAMPPGRYDDVMPALLRLMRGRESVSRAAHAFAAAGDTAALQCLLAAQHRAGLNARGDDGVTPLLVALRARRIGAVMWMLQRGADASAVDGSGRGALHELTSADGVRLCDALLAGGADPTHADAAGRTPLHAAAASLNLPVVICLLCTERARASLRMQDAARRTPLHCALVATPAAAQAATHAAAQADVLLQLLAVRMCADALLLADADGARPAGLVSHAMLPRSVCHALVAALRGMADEQLAEALRGCALHAIARVPGSAPLLCRALRLCSADAAAARARNGMLALHAAADAPATEALLRAFPDGVNAADAARRTPLWHRCQADDADSALLLLDAGASYGDEAADATGQTPEDVAGIGSACAALLQARSRAEEHKREARLLLLRARAAEAAVHEPTTPEGWQTAAAGTIAELRKAVAAYDPSLVLHVTGAPAAALAAPPAPSAAQRAAAAAALAAACAADPQLAALAALSERRWEIQLSREAKLALFALSLQLRVAAMRALARIADGDFSAARYLHAPTSDTGQLLQTDVAGMGELRLVFEVAVTYSCRAAGGVSCSEEEWEGGCGTYTQALRVWAVVPACDVAAAAERVSGALRAGAAAARAARVERRPRSAAEQQRPRQRSDVWPRTYRRLADDAPLDGGQRLELQPAADTSVTGELLLRTFTDAGDAFGRALLSGAAGDGLDWPLHLDAEEARIVALPFDATTLLVGRSGTGKTTVAVQVRTTRRSMGGRAMPVRSHTHETARLMRVMPVRLPQRMWRLYVSGVRRFMFITASSELRERVRAMFRRLQRGAGVALPDDADAPPSSLSRDAAWPLFLTSADWLLSWTAPVRSPSSRAPPRASWRTRRARPSPGVCVAQAAQAAVARDATWTSPSSAATSGPSSWRARPPRRSRRAAEACSQRARCGAKSPPTSRAAPPPRARRTAASAAQRTRRCPPRWRPPLRAKRRAA
jgi:hypothetical protein